MVDESDDIYFSNPNVTFTVSTTSGMVEPITRLAGCNLFNLEAIWFYFTTGTDSVVITMLNNAVGLHQEMIWL
jgi:hypothetical protein